ncbi:MAG TPA: hypothetical protein DEP42_00455, partial [Ruminococcaceae bacterium]|nr:hypothetical protein [Oscillospiraceae bacterium]
MAKKNKKNDNLDQSKRSAKVSAFFAKRSVRYGGAATLLTVIIIVAVILINVLVSSLSTRFTLSADMTTNKRSALSSESIKFVKNVGKQIDIDVLAEESTYASTSNYNSCLLILRQYAQNNTKIHLNFIDMDKNATFASKYPNETLSQGDIIVKSGDTYKHIASSDLLQTTSDGTGNSVVTGNNTEQVIDSAISYVTSKDFPTIIVSSGHNEADSTNLQTLLTKNNYQFETTDLSTANADQNAKMIVIDAPTADFTAAEITKLDDYLYNIGNYGKSVFLLFDPQQSSLPNLEGFAKKWGIGLSTGVIYDTTNAWQNTTNGYFDVLEGNMNSTYTGKIQSGLHADLSVSRPLTLLFTNQDGIATDSVISTNSTAKLWNPGSLSSQTAFTPSSTDQSGPFNVMAVATKSATVNNKAVNSNVLV